MKWDFKIQIRFLEGFDLIGVFNIIKPTGFTSSDVVVKIRGLLRRHYGIKNIKVGHLGTLDPGGSGVLPIVFGKATRLFDYLSQSDKKYRAEFVFGKTTDTLDSYGMITETSENIPNIEQISRVIPEFIGEIEQLPPHYSRISVGGVRSCDAVRRGVEIDIPTRKVIIKKIEIIRQSSGRVTLDIECGGGTYIRSLCRDIAKRLGTVAYMSFIIRLATKSLTVNNGVTIAEVTDDIEGNILPIDILLEGMPRYEIDEGNKILHGLDANPLGKIGDYIGVINGDVYGVCRDGLHSIETIVNLYDYGTN